MHAIKEAGGLVLVQQPETAQYDSMPRSAMTTGLVDYVLPPEEMPDRILDYMQRAFDRDAAGHGTAAETAAELTEPLQHVFALLRSHTRHDFSRYKHNTILRRIERRMAVHQVETIDEYVRLLQADSAEIGVLFRELLIGVTSFFRDPEAFASLRERVIPRYLRPSAMAMFCACGRRAAPRARKRTPSPCSSRSR